jgi:hypothetical protein
MSFARNMASSELPRGVASRKELRIKLINENFALEGGQ